VKRTLDQIPAGIKKPKPDQVATLGLGEFYACYGAHITKVYAQPVWLPEAKARQVARGEVPVELAVVAHGIVRTVREMGESNVTENEAKQLRDENAELRRTVGRLQEEVRLLGAGSHRVGSGSSQSLPRPDGVPFPTAAPDAEMRYQAFKARLMAEAPGILKVMVLKPELEVAVQREVIQADGRSVRGRIARLIADGFFESPKESSAVLAELMKRGANRPSNIELGNEMKALCEMGFFTRDNKWYTLVPGMKVNVRAA
jgi:hypothetical protein